MQVDLFNAYCDGFFGFHLHSAKKCSNQWFELQLQQKKILKTILKIQKHYRASATHFSNTALFGVNELSVYKKSYKKVSWS